jgi:hypothetical protein
MWLSVLDGRLVAAALRLRQPHLQHLSLDEGTHKSISADLRL